MDKVGKCGVAMMTQHSPHISTSIAASELRHIRKKEGLQVKVVTYVREIHHLEWYFFSYS